MYFYLLRIFFEKEIIQCGVIFFMVCFYFFYQKLNVTQEDIDKSRKSLQE
jgi:hypothetical protein